MARQSVYLAYETMVQGAFTPSDHNLLFVFQVNCPGCLLYGIPQANALYRQFADRGLSVLGVSTAFEAFGLNTLENTRLLLETGELVGDSKRQLEQTGLTQYDEPVLFPVAFDRIVDHATFREHYLIDFWRQQLSGHHQPDVPMTPAIRQELVSYTRQFERIPLTFLFNTPQGTPSWILFDQHQNVVKRWFGHKPLAEVQTFLESWL